MNNRSPDFEPLVGIEALREYLGGIPKKTVYKRTFESNINGFPFYKVGRHLRFRISEVSKLLKKYRSSGGVKRA